MKIDWVENIRVEIMLRNTVATSIAYTTIRNISILLLEENINLQIINASSHDVFVAEFGENISLNIPKKKPSKKQTQKFDMKEEYNKVDSSGWVKFGDYDPPYVRSTKFIVDPEFERETNGRSHFLIAPEDNKYDIHVWTDKGMRDLSPNERIRLARFIY
jgi:hypothetical protein